MKKAVSFICVFSVAMFLSGCTALLVGSGAIAGATISMDTVRLERKVDFPKAVEACRQVLEKRGKILQESKDVQGISLKALVDEAEILVEVTQVENKPVWIDVKARKKGLPALDLSEKLVDEINDAIRR
ncbi:MAG: DUF3568 family protein [Candidatus Omnitrophota bacterium]